jgi:predicted DNA-binding antitoxin AbrB/MazE fold protein
MDAAATTIDAVYSGGVLRPLGEVKLEENQHVRLTIQPAQSLPPAVAEWMAEAAALRQELFDKYGYYDDSTEIIASDRRRDG